MHMRSNDHLVNFPVVRISLLLKRNDVLPPKQDRKAQARQYIKILSQFNLSQQLTAKYALFDAKTRHLASRESVGGRSGRSTAF